MKTRMSYTKQSVQRSDDNCTKLEPVRKRIRVWTKLKNGVYAWRYKATAKKHALRVENDLMVEQSYPSAFAGKWVPAKKLVGNTNIMLDSSKNEN